MRVLHVVPGIAEEASGPSRSVPMLCRALDHCGVRVTLHTLDWGPIRGDPAIEVRQYPIGRMLRRLGISPAMRRALAADAATADLIHNHGLWMMPNVYPAWAARGAGCPLVTSPRGTLAAWALRRSRWRKRAFWLACQGRAVRQSALLHATAESEFEELRRMGLRAPVAIIPNGVEIPEPPAREVIPGGRRRLLFLGRIHPKKGVDLLLRAWRTVQDRAPDWDLELVGPDNDGYLQQMQDLAGSIGVERIAFRGPAYGQRKVEHFLGADLFVLPTHSENFGMAVAEALAFGIPAIVSRGAPWAGLASHDCGWWIDGGEGALTECLRVALALPREDLRDRGARGRAWMERDFSWERVGRMMHETYAWILGGGPPPPWVRRDG